MHPSTHSNASYSHVTCCIPCEADQNLFSLPAHQSNVPILFFSSISCSILLVTSCERQLVDCMIDDDRHTDASCTRYVPMPGDSVLTSFAQENWPSKTRTLWTTVISKDMYNNRIDPKRKCQSCFLSTWADQVDLFLGESWSRSLREACQGIGVR